MASQYPWSQIFGRDPKLRAADADREATAERLRKSHTEGRLDMNEFQQRLERCYAAKTIGELDELLTDLPREQDPSGPRSLGRFRAGRLLAVPFVPLLLAFILVSALAWPHAHHVFWVWILLAFLVWRLCWWRRRPWRHARRTGPDHWA